MYAAQSKNRIKNDRVQLYCVLYLVAWLLAPPLAYGTIYRLLAIVAAFVWLGLQIFRKPQKGTDPQSSRRLTTYLFCMCIYLVAVLFLECFIEERSILSVLLKNITTYILLFIGYIGGVYVAEKRNRDLKLIFYAALIIGVLFSLTSIFRSQEFYEYTRTAGGEDDAHLLIARQAAAKGVGAFGFFCFTSVFAPIVLWVYMKKRTWQYCAAFFILEIGVISAGYTLALIISLVGVLFCFMVNARSAFSKVMIIIMCVFLLLFWDVLVDEIYAFLYRITEGTFYHNKVIDIFRFIVEGESADTFQARSERYMLSLTTIFKYPLIGTLIGTGSRISGYHSSILDTYSIFGWGIGSLWLYLIVLFPAASIDRSHKNNRLLCWTAGTALFLTALFNRYVMMMGIFYLIYPALSLILTNTDSKENNNESIVGDVCGTGARGENYRKHFFAKRDVGRRDGRRFIRK